MLCISQIRGPAVDMVAVFNYSITPVSCSVKLLSTIRLLQQPFTSYVAEQVAGHVPHRYMPVMAGFVDIVAGRQICWENVATFVTTLLTAICSFALTHQALAECPQC